MSRFMLLDRGEELSDATAESVRAAASPIALRLLETAPPFREGQIIQVRPLGDGSAPAGAIVLCRRDGDFQLLRAARDLGGEVLGRVVAVVRGPVTFSIERGALAALPQSWRGRAVDALEVLARFRHPLTPPLLLGSAESCLRRVREKYDSAPEVRCYSHMATRATEAFELELVERHVKLGGRILDVGCGAGREAIGFARAGFRIVAIDIAPGMISAARQNAAREGLAIDFRVQSATDVDDPPGSYDGAFFSGSFQHIPGRALRIDTIRRIARSLEPDGVLVLAVMYRDQLGLLSRTRMVDLLRAAGARLFGPGRLSEPGDGYMRDVSEASDSSVPLFFHDFSGPAEVRGEIEVAGLGAEEVEPGWWVCRPR